MTEYFTKDGDEYKKVGETLFTQAEVDTNIIPARLERERKKFADYEELKKKADGVDTLKQEYEDKLKAANDAKATVEADLGKSKLEVVKVKAIQQFKLPEAAHEFVTGDTEDAIKASAEKLSKITPAGDVVINKSDKPDEKKTESNKLAKQIFGSKSD